VGHKTEEWHEAGEDQEAEELREFDAGPTCWAWIMYALKKVRYNMENDTTLVSQVWGEDFTMEERRWSRWAKDQKILIFGQRNILKTKKICVRPNKDLWIRLRLKTTGLQMGRLPDQRERSYYVQIGCIARVNWY
jgi:hypothetical protein